MARIACRRDGPRVHGFVGFDPLRQALYDYHQRKPTDKDPMAVVRRAIEVARISDSTSTKTTGGFVGVKLYPPMGFRAIDNEHLSDDRFNEPAYLRSPRYGARVRDRWQARCGSLKTLHVVQRELWANYGPYQP